jgi:hypothetical protein
MIDASFILSGIVFGMMFGVAGYFHKSYLVYIGMVVLLAIALVETSGTPVPIDISLDGFINYAGFLFLLLGTESSIKALLTKELGSR